MNAIRKPRQINHSPFCCLSSTSVCFHVSSSSSSFFIAYFRVSFLSLHRVSFVQSIVLFAFERVCLHWKIILGLLEPTTGKVLFDGVDIRRIGLVKYRQLIGSVMQNDTLLSGSLIENISFFDDVYDPLKVEQSCRLASIHDEIEILPMAYQTLRL